MTLALRGLSKQYGTRVALHPVDLEVQPGEVVLLVGPNGSGKSTLLALVAGLKIPSAGSATIGGTSTRTATGRAHLGVLPERPAMPGHHSLRALHRALGTTSASIDEMALSAHADRPIRDLSAGLHQRAALSLALAGSPRWLLLDEPLTAMDSEGAEHAIGAVQRRVAAGCGVLLATHHPERWAEVASRTVQVAEGRVS